MGLAPVVLAVHREYRMKRQIAAAVLVAFPFLVFGCAAPVMTVAGDVAGAAAGQAVGLFNAGKEETFQPFGIDASIAATRAAAADLDLKPVGETRHPDQLKLEYVDGRKQKIVITVVRRTDTLTGIHVDVGLFGVYGLSPTMLRQIISHLPKSPQTPHPTTTP